MNLLINIFINAIFAHDFYFSLGGNAKMTSIVLFTFLLM